MFDMNISINPNNGQQYDMPNLGARDESLISFINKSRAGQKKIIVVQGLGFVGAVMALVCANSIKENYAVIGVDLLNKETYWKIGSINEGVFPLIADDPKIYEYFERVNSMGNLYATYDSVAYKYADVIVVDINLDVIKSADNFDDYTVDLTGFKTAISTIGMHCKENALVLVETTVPPGTCEKIVSPILRLELGARGLDGNKIKIAHSYERVMPGPNYIDSIENFYRVYSGVNEESADAAEIFLKSIISIERYPLTRLGHTNATEMAKVLENSYRAMNIAFIVEWSRFAETSGVNLFEIVEAIRMRPTHSNMMLPGLGVGGYCLTKDPLLASWSRKNLFNDNEGLAQSEVAVKINDQMPSYAYQFFLKKFRRNVRSLNVSFFGVSYRGDVGDTRYSPVFNLYKYFNMGGCTISLHDPFISYWYEAEVDVEKNIDFALEGDIDIIIITTSHSTYLQESFVKKLCNLPRLFIFDTLGIFSEVQYRLLQQYHEVAVLGRGDF